MRCFWLLYILLLVSAGCENKKKYHDREKAELPNDTVDAIREILYSHKKLNMEFSDPETSPLPDRYRKDFKGLDFYKPDTNFRVMARLERTPDAVPFMMPTTTDRKSAEVLYGVAYFRLNGKAHELEIYSSPELKLEKDQREDLFLPFLDETNGDETYAGGRYINLSVPKGDSLLIDFNTAYNPYCAYNPKYSCPIVPKVNTLQTKIMAGVKAFKK